LPNVFAVLDLLPWWVNVSVSGFPFLHLGDSQLVACRVLFMDEFKKQSQRVLQVQFSVVVKCWLTWCRASRDPYLSYSTLCVCKASTQKSDTETLPHKLPNQPNSI
jgi:hypothetical protein